MKKKLLAILFSLTVVLQLAVPGIAAANEYYKTSNVTTKGKEMMLYVYTVWSYKDSVQIGVSIYPDDGWSPFDKKHYLTEDEYGMATITGYEKNKDIYVYNDMFFLMCNLDDMTFSEGVTREDFEELIGMIEEDDSLFYDEDYDFPLTVSAYIFRGKIRPSAIYVYGEKIATIEKYTM